VVYRVVVRPWPGAVLNMVDAVLARDGGDLVRRAGQTDQAWRERRGVLLHRRCIVALRIDGDEQRLKLIGFGAELVHGVRPAVSVVGQTSGQNV